MLAKALRQLREDAGLSREELANLCELSPDTIVSYENGRRKPDFDAVLKLESIFNTNASVLAGISNQDQVLHIDTKQTLSKKHREILELFDQANKQAQDSAIFILQRGRLKIHDKQAQDEFSSETFPFMISIPVVGRAAAGLPIEMIEQQDERISVDGVRYGDFAVVATGDSMVDAGISDGDRVIIRPQATVENGELALVAMEDGSTIKRFYVTVDGFKLEPANSQYETQYYSKDTDVRILGKVIKVINK